MRYMSEGDSVYRVKKVERIFRDEGATDDVSYIGPYGSPGPAKSMMTKERDRSRPVWSQLISICVEEASVWTVVDKWGQ